MSSRRLQRRLDVGPGSFATAGRSREVVGVLVCFLEELGHHRRYHVRFPFVVCSPSGAVMDVCCMTVSVYCEYGVGLRMIV